MSGEKTLEDLLSATGRIEGKLDAVDTRLDSMEKNIELVRSSNQQLGVQVGVISSACPRHEKRISTLEHAVNQVDHTGRLHVATQTATWKTLTLAAATIVGAVGLAATVMQFFK